MTKNIRYTFAIQNTINIVKKSYHTHAENVREVIKLIDSEKNKYAYMIEICLFIIMGMLCLMIFFEL